MNGGTIGSDASDGGEGVRDLDGTEVPPVTRMLQRPAIMVRHELIAGLHAAGFDDILPAQLGVFQHPGPDGQRPGVLAARTRASKQAMNHLLHQLETGGYLHREPHDRDRRTRVVRLTERGWQALEVIRVTALEVERRWAAALGEPTYTELRRTLAALDTTLDSLPGSGVDTAGNGSRNGNGADDD